MDEPVGLDLSNNKLEYLPESLGDIKIDGYLDLSSNKLNILPKSFFTLDSKKITHKIFLNNNLLSEEQIEDYNELLDNIDWEPPIESDDE